MPIVASAALPPWPARRPRRVTGPSLSSLPAGLQKKARSKLQIVEGTSLVPSNHQHHGRAGRHGGRGRPGRTSPPPGHMPPKAMSSSSSLGRVSPRPTPRSRRSLIPAHAAKPPPNAHGGRCDRGRAPANASKSAGSTRRRSPRCVPPGPRTRARLPRPPWAWSRSRSGPGWCSAPAPMESAVHQG